MHTHTCAYLGADNALAGAEAVAHGLEHQLDLRALRLHVSLHERPLRVRHGAVLVAEALGHDVRVVIPDFGVMTIIIGQLRVK